jgi:hypothetical protein
VSKGRSPITDGVIRLDRPNLATILDIDRIEITTNGRRQQRSPAPTEN